MPQDHGVDAASRSRSGVEDRRRLRVFPTLVLSAVLASCSTQFREDAMPRGRGSPLATPRWGRLAPMGMGRSGHTATLPPSGKVLFVGGSGPSVLSDAEVLGPATGTWTATGPLNGLSASVAPLETSITSMPPAVTAETSATFAFSSSEAGATFECSLQEGSFSPCSSPVTFHALPDGAYTFRVRAVDEAGHTDETPASHAWRVDLLAPESEFLRTPANPSNQRSATFSFTSSEEGSSFECRLDAAAFASCTSPVVLSSLTAGPHTFQVRARDALGHVEDTPATYVWQVDLTAPLAQIDSGPANPTQETTATFAFSADEAGASFLCSLDGAPATPCTSPLSFASLAEGGHDLQVQARDAAGNRDPFYAAIYPWRIDLTAPAAPAITSPSNGAMLEDRVVTFTGTAERGSTVHVTLDGVVIGSTPTSGEGSWSLTPPSELAEGEHTVTAMASDIAGSSVPGAAVRFTIGGGGPGDPPPSGGCGCGAGSGDASWMLAGLAVLVGAVSRRRRLLA